MAEQQELESKSSGSFVERLAEKLGGVARANTIFGPVIEREGITVIPVGKVRYGFGGGEGRKQDEQGSGGGGGVQVLPVGFIELKNGSAEFPWAAIALGGALGFLVFRRLLRQ